MAQQRKGGEKAKPKVEINPLHIWITAESFSMTSIFLHNLVFKEGVARFLDPYVVNAAFATELHLKCLFFVLENKLPKGNEHNLGKLFDQLDPKERVILGQKFEEARSSLKPITLREYLYAYGDAFKEWRYGYEKGEGERRITTFNTAQKTIYYRTLEHRPDFAEWEDGLTPDDVLEAVERAKATLRASNVRYIPH